MPEAENNPTPTKRSQPFTLRIICLNLFVFFGTLYSITTLDHADPALRHSVTGVLDMFTHASVPLGKPIPKEFPENKSGKTLAFFLSTCLGCNAKTLVFVNRLVADLQTHGYTVVVVSRSTREQIAPLLENKDGKGPFLRSAYVPDPGMRIMSALQIHHVPLVLEFAGGKSVWVSSNKENWFVSMQKHLNADGMGSATADLSTSIKPDLEKLQSLLEACTASEGGKP